MTDTEATTTLDHFDNISVPGDVFKQPANEYWALVCLWTGMEHLYRQVSHCDETVRQRVNPDGNHKVAGFGNLPELDAVSKPLVTCAFHWYSISACQYVRTVGAIAHRLDDSRPRPRDYAEGIIPEVLAFRDKVAAHFAWTTQNNNDNAAERLASVMPPLSVVDDALHVGALTLRVSRGGQASNSDAISPWSLCRVHERLRERYWPASEADDAESVAAAEGE